MNDGSAGFSAKYGGEALALCDFVNFSKFLGCYVLSMLSVLEIFMYVLFRR